MIDLDCRIKSGNDRCDRRRSIGTIVLQRSRCSSGICERHCALKGGSPGQARGRHKKNKVLGNDIENKVSSDDKKKRVSGNS